MAWIKLNATDPPPPDGCANVHFRQAAGHLGTELDPFPVTAFRNGDKATFLVGVGSGITGVIAANDITNHFPIRSPGTPIELVGNVKAGPASDLHFDIKRSADSGTTWTTILTGNLVLPSSSVTPVRVTTFATATVFVVGDLLRMDLISGTALDVTIVLIWS